MTPGVVARVEKTRWSYYVDFAGEDGRPVAKPGGGTLALVVYDRRDGDDGDACVAALRAGRAAGYDVVRVDLVRAEVSP